MADATPALRLGPVGQLSVAVQDLERATAFYRDTLGLPFLFAAPGMAFFDGGGPRLMLATPEGEDSGGTSILYFQVDDIRAAYRTLEEKGVRVVHAPRLVAPMADHDLWLAFFKDSEGNLMALMGQEPKQG